MGFICCFVRVLSGTISLENYQLSSQEAKHMWNPLSAITLTGQMALGLLPYLPILIVFSQVKWYNNCYGKSKTLQVPEWRQWARDHGRPRRQPDPRQGVACMEWTAWWTGTSCSSPAQAPCLGFPAWDCCSCFLPHHMAPCQGPRLPSWPMVSWPAVHCSVLLKALQ